MLKAYSEAPDFKLTDEQGRVETLQDLLLHGPALLAFFKVSCPTCQLAFPFLDRLFREARVPVTGISQNDAAATRQFRSTFGVTFQTLIDPESEGYPVSNAYRIDHVPSLFLVEPDGSISLSETGFSRDIFEQIASRFGGRAFRDGEQVPEYKPG